MLNACEALLLGVRSVNPAPQNGHTVQRATQRLVQCIQNDSSFTRAARGWHGMDEVNFESTSAGCVTCGLQTCAVSNASCRLLDEMLAIVPPVQVTTSATASWSDKCCGQEVTSVQTIDRINEPTVAPECTMYSVCTA